MSYLATQSVPYALTTGFVTAGGGFVGGSILKSISTANVTPQNLAFSYGAFGVSAESFKSYFFGPLKTSGMVGGILCLGLSLSLGTTTTLASVAITSVGSTLGSEFSVIGEDSITLQQITTLDDYSF